MNTKSRLRDYLAKQQGNWLSGEYLSEEMNVSRAAIWKHIRTLRDEGFVIESVTNKGYRLVQTRARITWRSATHTLKQSDCHREDDSHFFSGNVNTNRLPFPSPSLSAQILPP